MARKATTTTTPKENQSMAPKEVLVPVRLLFVGTCGSDPGNKTCGMWLTESQFDKLRGPAMNLTALRDIASIFELRKGQKFYPGHIYVSEGELDGDRVIRLLSSKLQWSGDSIEAKSPMWLEAQVMMQQRVTAMRMVKQHDQMKEAGLDELIKPFRKIWITTDGIGRAALEANILRALRGGPGFK